MDEIYKMHMDTSTAFNSLDTKVFSEGDNFVYVAEKEIATVNPKFMEPDFWLGSSDATTCHILIVRHKNTGITSVAHLNAIDCIQENLTQLVNELQNVISHFHCDNGLLDSDNFSIYVLGGFDDSEQKNISSIFSSTLLSEINLQFPKCLVKLACLSKLNDTVKHTSDGLVYHAPLHYGIAINLHTGVVVPAEFTYRGPELPLRHARLWQNVDQLYSIYDVKHNTLRFQPFPFKNHFVFHINKYPDEWILKHMSTSPLCEPPRFVEDIRNSYTFLQQNTWENYFKNGDKLYKFIDRNWKCY